jgi:hypothetical protein
MAGLVPAIHALLAHLKTWMPAQASLRRLRKLGCKRGHDGLRGRENTATAI